ncbi:HAD domain-containing protein [Variovorax ureilyticus]|uniref:HAD domain-containing protein n=1 Tax=Variovorax ureilyticus TaxID=1836198 RepID=UPI003D67ABC4
MRVIFCDFDGVLHPAGGPPGFVLPFEWLPELVTMLKEVDDVSFVVSSTWRETYSVDELRDFLEPLGDRHFGVVEPGPKADAIERFLAQHPEITDAVVLDDEPMDFPVDLSLTVVKCSPSLGIACPKTQEELRAWFRAEHRRRFIDDCI